MGERRIIHYPQKRIIGLYVSNMKFIRLFKDKRETKYALIFGAIFSVVNLLAKEMQTILYIDFRHFIYFLLNEYAN